MIFSQALRMDRNTGLSAMPHTPLHAPARRSLKKDAAAGTAVSVPLAVARSTAPTRGGRRKI
jgi:hypothetical protein